MAGASQPSLSIAVANAGGLGACGAWAGQSAAMARAEPAAAVVDRVWKEARALLA
jgi:nitronate monooxygenase